MLGRAAQRQRSSSYLQLSETANGNASTTPTQRRSTTHFSHAATQTQSSEQAGRSTDSLAAACDSSRQRKEGGVGRAAAVAGGQSTPICAAHSTTLVKRRSDSPAAACSGWTPQTVKRRSRRRSGAASAAAGPGSPAPGSAERVRFGWHMQGTSRTLAGLQASRMLQPVHKVLHSSKTLHVTRRGACVLTWATQSMQSSSTAGWSRHSSEMHSSSSSGQFAAIVNRARKPSCVH